MDSIKVNDIVFEVADFWDYYNENYRNHRIIRVIGDEGLEEAKEFKSSFKEKNVAVIYCTEDYLLHENKLIYCGTRIEYYNSAKYFIEKEIKKELIGTLDELRSAVSTYLKESGQKSSHCGFVDYKYFIEPVTTSIYRSLRGVIRSGNFDNYKKFLLRYYTGVSVCSLKVDSPALSALCGTIDRLISRATKSTSDENRNVLEGMFRRQCEISVGTRDVEIWHDHMFPLIRTRDDEYPIEFNVDDLGRLNMKTSTGGNGLRFIDFYGAKSIQDRMIRIQRPYSDLSKDMNIASALFEMWNRFVLRKEFKPMKIL